MSTTRHRRRTLRLEPATWDLTLDGVGRIALARDEAATAQNVANEARLFTNDAYFARERGVPHFLIELGRRVNVSAVRSCLRRAALSVPDVKEVLSVEITDFDPKTRAPAGDIRFSTFGRSSAAPMSARVNLAGAPSSPQRPARFASADGLKGGER